MAYHLFISTLEELKEKEDQLTSSWLAHALRAVLLDMLQNNKKNSSYDTPDQRYFMDDEIVIIEWSWEPKEMDWNDEVTITPRLWLTTYNKKIEIRFERHGKRKDEKDERDYREEPDTVFHSTQLELSELKKYINEMDNFLKTWKTIL